MRPHLYKRPCPSVGWLVGWLVGRSVMLLSKSRKKEGLGGRRHEEEGGIGRKEGRGGRRDKESEKVKKLLKK